MERDDEGKEAMNDELTFGGDSEDLPNGTYPARLVRTEIQTSKRTGNDYRRWTFQLDGHGELSGVTSASLGTKSFAAKWITALVGHTPAKGEAVNAVGRPCLVVVTSDRTGWPEIDDVMPPLAANAPVPAETVPVVTAPAGELP